MEQYPLVSIGIPNYNYGHYILKALESAVNQTYPNIEVVIVDDCSTDNSVAIIEKWIDEYKGKAKMKFLKNETNLGLPGSCNIILNNASGKYYQTLDADDLIFEDKIIKQVPILEADNNVCLVYSNAVLIDENGEAANMDYLTKINYESGNMPEGNIFKQLFSFNFIPLPSVLINTEMARQSGGYDSSLQVQDYFLWLKLSKLYRVVYLPSSTAYYRVHKKSMSNNATSNARSIDSVLQIKYQYYKNAEAGIQKIIRNNIHFSTLVFYEHKYPSAGLWLKRDLKLNPGIKSLFYYVSFKLGISFKFFNTLKNMLPNKRNNSQ